MYYKSKQDFISSLYRADALGFCQKNLKLITSALCGISIKIKILHDSRIHFVASLMNFPFLGVMSLVRLIRLLNTVFSDDLKMVNVSK